MPEKLKVLISCYACSPYKGSEPGMGWNFVQGLSKFHELHVIVEQLKWEKPIKNYIKDNPQITNNITFHFIEKKRNKLLRKIWPPSYYWYYRKWQKKVYNLALKLDKKENFDIIHQLNMVGYREPGYLWKIKSPFVWGPIGGLENSPWNFLPHIGLKGLIFYSARNLVNLLQRNLLIRPKKAVSRANSILISATPNVAFLAKQLWKKDSDIICEVGQEKIKLNKINHRSQNEPLKIIWCGVHEPRKNLKLLLEALSKVTINFELHILGDGEMKNKWKKSSESLGIAHNCYWHGWVDKEEVKKIYQIGHVFCITSISDLTSTVTLEALSYALPVICLDHCGFSHVINDSCGVKISVKNYNDAVNDFANIINTLYKQEDYRIKLSKGAILRSEDFSWDKKIKKINYIYSSLLKEN
jgi:glycosyltransferase involved in cell wall biosynthesis